MKKAAGKKKQVAKKQPKKLTLMDRIPKDDGERLELILKMTEKRIDLDSFDMTMENQANRIRKELAEWRKNNPK